MDGKDRPTCQDRLNAARKRLGRVSCLLRFGKVSVLTSACHSCGNLEHMVRVWCGGHLETTPAAPLDFQFVADYQTIFIEAKLVQFGRARWQPSAMRGTWQYAVHAAHLKNMDWHIQYDGPWTHQATPRRCISWARNLQLDRIKHLLREAWRFERFEAWRASGDWMLWLRLTRLSNQLASSRFGNCGMSPGPTVVRSLPLQWSAQYGFRPIKVALLCNGALSAKKATLLRGIIVLGVVRTSARLALTYLVTFSFFTRA